MLKRNKKEFNKLTKKIRYNHEFNKLHDELHHGINRYDHCLRVAKVSYSTLKFLNLNYEDGTKGALLHDFYLNETNNKETLFTHPNLALNNSMKYCQINDMEKDIIKTHMFPLNKEDKPKYKESWIVSMVDKLVSLYEIIRFKSIFKLNLYLLFIINIFTEI